MKLRVVIVGIPGVGKTTVVDRLVPLVKGASLVTFGSVMFSEAKKRRLVKDRDELRKLTVDKQKELQKLAATSISKMEEKVVIVDTHLFIRTKEGFWPGLPFEVATALKPTHLVLIEASPADVLKRRSADTSRTRDPVTKAGLESEMMLAREFLVSVSTITGAPMLTVRNEDGGADTAAERLAEVLEGASS